MSNRVIRVSNRADDALRRGIQQIWAEQHLDPVFPPEVEAEAASARPRMPERDLTDVPFVTLDPAESRDLDQAMHLERSASGYVVHYAIACLPAFLEPGGAVDQEARRRGETLYGADTKIPLHPPVLSEGAASLLPDQECPAYVWTIGLDRDGVVTKGRVERARVRSRAKLAYGEVQRQLDAGSAPEMLQLLREIGELRLRQEAARGGVSLPTPTQEIVIEDEAWRLEFRRMQPVESWNAQISLLTGAVAADLMLGARVGILRTLPPPEQSTIDRLHSSARALHVDWPDGTDYATFIRGLDPAVPAEAAMSVVCTAVLRGAGYTAFDGSLPEQTQHAAMATSYAHVTAPLRRLVDRFGLETCAAICAGEQVSDWVRSALPDLPGVMQESGRRSHAYERAVLDLVEAHVLQGSVGTTFEGVVLEEREEGRGTAQIADPAVEARVTGRSPLPVGERTRLTLAEADPATRKVSFRVP